VTTSLAQAPTTRSYRWLAAPILAGAIFSLAAGLLSRHDPRAKGYFRLFFSDPIHMKAGFATAAALLACFQIFSAAWIFRKLPWQKPAWINPAHRWSGRLAFVCTLPVAYHCIYKLGWQDASTRTLLHSGFGTLFYGAYAAKVTIVRLHRFPRFVLPVAGGLVFSLLIGIWLTSALWLYRQNASAAPPPVAATTHVQGDATAGRAVFGQAGCGDCHTLKAAGTSGVVGPNLDDRRPPFDRVRARVESGGGAMPAFAGKLSEKQIRDVAAFVALNAGR
jgi:mono/diheme cytochrome c family protein